MNKDQLLHNVRNMMPKVYTMAVAHGIRAFEKKTGREATREEKTMLEAMSEGFTYTFIPMLAATLAELEASRETVEPPTEPEKFDGEGITSDDLPPIPAGHG